MFELLLTILFAALKEQKHNASQLPPKQPVAARIIQLSPQEVAETVWCRAANLLVQLRLDEAKRLGSDQLPFDVSFTVPKANSVAIDEISIARVRFSIQGTIREVYVIELNKSIRLIVYAVSVGYRALRSSPAVKSLTAENCVPATLQELQTAGACLYYRPAISNVRFFDRWPQYRPEK